MSEQIMNENEEIVKIVAWPGDGAFEGGVAAGAPPSLA
jgi:hypothetical protein